MPSYSVAFFFIKVVLLLLCIVFWFVWYFWGILFSRVHSPRINIIIVFLLYRLHHRHRPNHKTRFYCCIIKKFFFEEWLFFLNKVRTYIYDDDEDQRAMTLILIHWWWLWLLWHFIPLSSPSYSKNLKLISIDARKSSERTITIIAVKSFHTRVNNRYVMRGSCIFRNLMNWSYFFKWRAQVSGSNSLKLRVYAGILISYFVRMSEFKKSFTKGSPIILKIYKY